MSGDTKRTVALLSVLAVVAALVVLDRAGGGPGSGSETAEPSSGVDPSGYGAQSARLARARAEVEAGGDWRAAREEALEAWEARRGRMIAAPSAQIAAARLRGMIEPALRDEGLSLESSETLQTARAGEDERMALVGLSLSFRALEVDSVYRVLDRIEHLAGAATSVEAVTLRGPGRLGRGGGVEATVRVRAAAWVEGGSSRG